MRQSLSSSLRRAVHGVSGEILGFSVEYPLEVVPDAERRGSLRYHLYSPTLFLENQQLDSLGVPRRGYRLLGPQYNPLFVAWWGLHHLERAARDGDARHRDVFEMQLEWLRNHAVMREDGAAVWPCHFDWQEGLAHLRAPWISAMYQGVVISALVRGFRLSGDAALLELARVATRVFAQDVTNGGVRTREAGYTLYEEYPAVPLPRVLDGFLFSLIGLYDLYAETGDESVRQLFVDGVQGLVHQLGWWSYRGKWSWYGSHGYLCPPHYHVLNCALLSILHRLSGESVLGAVADAWSPRRLTRGDRAEVFLVFAVTKNWARLRLPNERGS